VQGNTFRSGTLTTRIFSGRGLTLPPGVQLPDVIKKAVENSPPSRRSMSKRESMQRRRHWWYVIAIF
jgi:serum/glucocorticoid-regulated kinase 2